MTETCWDVLNRSRFTDLLTTGTIVNIPFSGEEPMRDADYLAAWRVVVEPVLIEFQVKISYFILWCKLQSSPPYPMLNPITRTISVLKFTLIFSDFCPVVLKLVLL